MVQKLFIDPSGFELKRKHDHCNMWKGIECFFFFFSTEEWTKAFSKFLGILFFFSCKGLESKRVLSTKKDKAGE